MIEKFVKFLNDEGIFDLFQERFTKYRPILKKERAKLRDVSEDFVAFLVVEKAPYHQYFSKCVLWEKTTEGHRFWSEYNQKWLILVQKLKKKKK